MNVVRRLRWTVLLPIVAALVACSSHAPAPLPKDPPPPSFPGTLRVHAIAALSGGARVCSGSEGLDVARLDIRYPEPKITGIGGRFISPRDVRTCDEPTSCEIKAGQPYMVPGESPEPKPFAGGSVTVVSRVEVFGTSAQLARWSRDGSTSYGTFQGDVCPPNERGTWRPRKLEVTMTLAGPVCAEGAEIEVPALDLSISKPRIRDREGWLVPTRYLRACDRPACEIVAGTRYTAPDALMTPASFPGGAVSVVARLRFAKLADPASERWDVLLGTWQDAADRTKAGLFPKALTPAC